MTHTDPQGEGGPKSGEPTRQAGKAWELFTLLCQFCELMSFVAVIVGVPFAFYEYRHQHYQERIDLAEKTYREVDSHYMDFMKLCLDHPKLDCYSTPLTPRLDPSLSEEEKVQQKVLFSILINVFQAVYFQYKKSSYVSVPEPLQTEFKSQWNGWDIYIKKFIDRPAYRQTWCDIRNEYDQGFVGYMNDIMGLQTGGCETP